MYITKRNYDCKYKLRLQRPKMTISTTEKLTLTHTII